MTLIATLTPNGAPVLIGDILLTGETPTPSSNLPAAGDVPDFFPNTGWGFSGLSQKVNLISKNCAIAWSGSWLGARLAISRLRQRALEKVDLDLESITECLNNDPDLASHPASFVGILNLGTTVRTFHFGAQEEKFLNLGTVYFAGTGEIALRDYEEYLATANYSQSTDSINPSIRAVATAIQLASLLVTSEYFGGNSATTLLNMFGGGYETAYPNGNTIEKISELLLVVWNVQISDQTISISNPEHFLKQEYQKEHLLTRSIKIATEKMTGKLSILYDNRHIIEPMFDCDAIDARAAASNVQLASRRICHAIVVRGLDRQARSITLYKCTPSAAEQSLRIIEQPSGVTLEIDRGLMDEVANLVSGYLKPA